MLASKVIVDVDRTGCTVCALGNADAWGPSCKAEVKLSSFTFGWAVGCQDTSFSLGSCALRAADA